MNFPPVQLPNKIIDGPKNQAGKPASSSPAYFGGHYYGAHHLAAAPIIGEISVRRLFRIIRRKWLTLLAVTTLALTGGAFYLTTTQNIFRASSLIEMSVRRPRISGQQGAVISDDVPYQSEEIFNTRVEKFRSNILQEMARKIFCVVVR